MIVNDSWVLKLFKRFGALAFLFFFVKGLVWLALFAAGGAAVFHAAT